MDKSEYKPQEKRNVALSSIAAAIFLTGFKLVVGVMTGSLGILSEALHSGLDLIAAIITYFSVRFSDLPPDENHNYGHGKIENYSALVETILLFITCVWIIYEAVRRIITHEVEIDVTIWSYIVVISSIIIDISRSRALKKAAIKYNSQALEADALHFSTDILSSLVVLIGLIASSFNFFYADSIAAFAVSIIVLIISFRLGKRSFDALIDKAPPGVSDTVKEILDNHSEVKYYHNLKIRESGPYKFIDVNIHVEKTLDIMAAHNICDEIEVEISRKIKRSQTNIHLEPDIDENP
ncbi:MAG TPA: cation diffusion facilitator family transporter [Ignavibacteriaceae bacterium]|nr:cation diffusion facilitator family transporter [Ignavibacteriaceae bacterium]